MSIRPYNPNPLAVRDRERACLRLLYQNYNAKQIGRQLGISPHTPHTVYRHLQEARRLSGISRSMDLAILLGIRTHGTFGAQLPTSGVRCRPAFSMHSVGATDGSGEFLTQICSAKQLLTCQMGVLSWAPSPPGECPGDIRGWRSRIPTATRPRPTHPSAASSPAQRHACSSAVSANSCRSSRRAPTPSAQAGRG